MIDCERDLISRTIEQRQIYLFVLIDLFLFVILPTNEQKFFCTKDDWAHAVISKYIYTSTKVGTLYFVRRY